MSFSNYKSIGIVAKEYKIKCLSNSFVVEVNFPVGESFREELKLLFSEGVVNNSEAAICENLIYPVLKEVWKVYRRKFILWSHETLYYDEKLSGVPDYILAARSPLGTVVFDKPYFLTVEAKQDKFTEGWGQCLAEMVAVQKSNQDSEQTIYGIVSNGLMWQFGNLKGDTFTQNNGSYLIEDLTRLFGAVNYVFQQCELQVGEVLG